MNGRNMPLPAELENFLLGGFYKDDAPTALKQNNYGLRDREALFRVFQHGLDLFAGHAGKPFEKIVHRRAVFEILKQRRHRHARVPLNSHAPLTFPAMRSTAAHLLQSNMTRQ